MESITLTIRVLSVKANVHHWRSLYEAALREQGPAKLPELCQQARLAIFPRQTLIGATRSPLPTRTRKSESEELKEAMIGSESTAQEQVLARAAQHKE